GAPRRQAAGGRRCTATRASPVRSASRGQATRTPPRRPPASDPRPARAWARADGRTGRRGRSAAAALRPTHPPNRSGAPKVTRRWALDQNLGRRLERAAGLDELDCAMQVGFRVRQLLCERQGVARFDQHMQAPGFDLLALRLWVFDRLGHRGRSISLSPRRTLPQEVCPEPNPLRLCGEVVKAARQFVKGYGDHRALRFRVGLDLAQALAEAGFDLVGAILERDERRVALPLECVSEARKPLLDALCRSV